MKDFDKSNFMQETQLQKDIRLTLDKARNSNEKKMTETEEEKKKNIYQRLLEIMRDISYIQKGPKKVGGMYTYVSHDAVSEAFHPLFVKHGVMVIPSILEITQDGNRTNVLLEVKFINTDRPDDQFSVTYAGYGIDSSDKGPGKAISYAYKYALLKTFCLETGDDPDNEQKSKHEKSESNLLPISTKTENISKPQLQLLGTELKDHEDILEGILTGFEINKLSDLHAKHYQKCITRIREIKKTKEAN